MFECSLKPLLNQILDPLWVCKASSKRSQIQISDSGGKKLYYFAGHRLRFMTFAPRFSDNEDFTILTPKVKFFFLNGFIRDFSVILQSNPSLSIKAILHCWAPNSKWCVANNKSALICDTRSLIMQLPRFNTTRLSSKQQIVCNQPQAHFN